MSAFQMFLTLEFNFLTLGLPLYPGKSISLRTSCMFGCLGSPTLSVSMATNMQSSSTGDV